MKVIVSENHFKKIMGVEGVPSETLLEDVAIANELNTLTIVQQKINELLSDPKKEKGLLDGISLTVTWNGKVFILQIGNNKYTMKRMVRAYTLYLSLLLDRSQKQLFLFKHLPRK